MYSHIPCTQNAAHTPDIELSVPVKLSSIHVEG